MIHLPIGIYYKDPHKCISFNEGHITLRAFNRFKVNEKDWSQPHCIVVPTQGVMLLVEVQGYGVKRDPPAHKFMFRKAIFKDLDKGNLWACTNYHHFSKFRSLSSLFEVL